MDYYNPFLVYCRELAPGTVSLTGDRAQGDDSKHDLHYSISSIFTLVFSLYGSNYSYIFQCVALLLVVCSLLAMIFVLLHCHPAT